MLVLISKIKKRLLWLWLGFSIPILLLIFVQSIAGKYTEIEMTPWVWVAVNLIPGFIVLLLAAIQKKNSGKFIQTFVFRVIFLLALIYLVLLLMTLVSMSAAAPEQSIAEYFKNSYPWLVPFQVLLVGVFILLYFKKETIFRPNEKMIKKYLLKEKNKAAEKNNIAQEQAFELLTNNDYPTLFNTLKNSFHSDQTQHNQIILLHSQYNKWKKNTDLGLMDKKDAQLNINRITMALIHLIEKL
ncbi:MAG TPA: hypothetical protein ENJ45_03720 [Phaeodactylibacter sp.]|nr:hypothetical protein [Phaeodactylibacter sp.]